ncbi:small subunit rRNA maturation protein UTP4 KNAG_0C05420 [Huiozyma naganishii CBS 8797]|uniref:Uncharacterized protein n=1 Tax=Huiozyma naganishii (strain ATCC MYA-139 / BCRC 22969 / CBS 8797 / KCTC 17520 / NBRC 10181 / NCYC 3082 / Yp74L-3) TaxID=1071383 RepID=J7R468_HUIN7|nr:hypothetical protein KNAG_0C05420 [Kazachstania naganishii CBS 8797]CCK69640.1 hypothetical protein KNAG_0C05420 [Kazachstania naganishii CBS 8797]
MTGHGTVVHRARFCDFLPGNITSLAFSHRSTASKLTPSDLRLAVGKSDGTVDVWNPRNNWIQEFAIGSGGGEGRSIEGLVWCNVRGQPLRLFSIGGSTTITEWDLRDGSLLKNYDCNAGVIWSIGINRSQDKLAVGCDNGAVVIVDISGGSGSLEHDTILARQESRILNIAWNGDEFVIGGCSDGKIRVWSAAANESQEAARGRLLHTMKVDKARGESTLVWSVLYLPNLNQIVSGDSTGSVKFWDFQYATLLQSFKPHEADVLCLTADVDNNSVFTAGVDRKIFQFSYSTASNKQSSRKWVNAANRLFHGNDVRAMAAYQSRGADFLVSGGVEKTFVVSSLSSFANGNYRKMTHVPATAQRNVLLAPQQRYIVMWQNSTVKVWYLGTDVEDEKNYRLVCKLSLNKEDEPILRCTMSFDGQVLVVSRMSSTKIFHLLPNETMTKLKVTKLDNDFLLKTGSKFVKFVDSSVIVVCTPDDELFTLDLESDIEGGDEKPTELEMPAFQGTKSTFELPYLARVNHMDVTEGYVVVSRGCGIVDIIDLKTHESKSLIRLTDYITALKINTEKSSVIVVTSENKIYELRIDDGANAEGGSEILTEWSKKCTDNLPRRFQNLKDKCNGIFLDKENCNMVWFWGTSWLVRFDFSLDLPLSKRKKVVLKRGRDGLTITDESNFMNDATVSRGDFKDGENNDDDEDDDDDDDDEDGMDLSVDDAILRANARDSNSSTSSVLSRAKTESQAFFISDKFKPSLYAGFINSKEIVVVERPLAQLQAQQKAFHLSKLVF